MKKSGIFGVKDLDRYNAGGFMTFLGLVVSIIGGITAMAGYELSTHSMTDEAIRFPGEEAVDVMDCLCDNCSNGEEG